MTNKWHSICELCLYGGCSEPCYRVLIETDQEPIVPAVMSSAWKAFPQDIRLSKAEAQVVSLLKYRMPRADICALLGISRNALRQTLKRLKRKVERHEGPFKWPLVGYREQQTRTRRQGAEYFLSRNYMKPINISAPAT